MNTIQIALDSLRVKKSAVTSREIERIKLQLKEKDIRILKINVKPSTVHSDNGGAG